MLAVEVRQQTLSADDRCSVPAANTERAWSRLGSSHERGEGRGKGEEGEHELPLNPTILT